MSTSANRPRTRTAYTDAQRVAALTALAANDNNMALTSREQGIPRATLQQWRDAMAPALTASNGTLAERMPALAERTLAEIEHIGFGNLSDVASWDASGQLTIVPSDELTPRQAALISEVRLKRTRKGNEGEWEVEELQIKTRDKLGALRTLAEITRLKPEKGGTEINFQGDGAQILVLDRPQIAPAGMVPGNGNGNGHH